MIESEILKSTYSSLVPEYLFGNIFDAKIFRSLLRYLCIKMKSCDLSTDERLYHHEYWNLSDYLLQDVVKQSNELSVCHCTSKHTRDDIAALDCGFIELNTNKSPVNQFISQKTNKNVQVFVNEKIKSVIVFTNGDADDKLYWSIFSCMCKIWTWIFDASNEADSQLSKLCYEENEDKVIEYINDYLTQSKLKERLLLKQLKEFSNASINDRIENCKLDITNKYSDHEDYYKRAMNCMYRIKELEKELQMLLNSKNDEDEFVKMFQQHKELTIDQIDANVITYLVVSTIEYYDVDEFINVQSNRGITFLSKATNAIRKLLNELIVKNRGHLIAISKFEFTIGSITPIKNTASRRYPIGDYIPHPHIGGYACLGGNSSPLRQAIADSDYDLAITQTIAATKNMNFGDSTVMDYLVGLLDDYYYKPNKIILADNTPMSIVEFLAYCDELDKKEEKDSNE